MPTRSAKADWQGDFKRGGGSVSTETGVLDAPYNFSGRFESGTGTNPEELLGAAHASCFTMALSRRPDPGRHAAGVARHRGARHRRSGRGRVRDHEDRALGDAARCPGSTPPASRRPPQGAKAGCPLSKALAAVPEITLETNVRELGSK